VPIDAIAGLLLVHVPPATVLLSVVLPPVQIVVVPDIVPAVLVAETVTITVVEQPVPRV
jgi:hypothetical protein